MIVYTICLTVEAEPKQLALAIKEQFSGRILAYSTDGPFDVAEVKANDGRVIIENTYRRPYEK